LAKGRVIIYGGGGGSAPKRNVFLGKYFADPTIKKFKKICTQPQLKNKHPPLAKNCTKDTI
jgi:hypothetical protein